MPKLHLFIWVPEWVSFFGLTFLVLGVLFGSVLFGGEPDMVDAMVHRQMTCED